MSVILIQEAEQPERYLIAPAYLCLVQCVRHSRIVLDPHAFLTNLERHHFIHHERNVLVAFVHFVVFPHGVYKERFQHILLMNKG